MIESSPEERWSVMLVQAQRFANQSNFTDAVGRARLAAAEIEAALQQAADGERGMLAQRLAFVQAEVARFERAHETWLEERRALERGRRENAAEELARPLRTWS